MTSDKQLPSLDTLQKKIDEAKRLAGGENPDASNDGDGSIGRAIQWGVELLAGVAVGCFIGFFIDRWLGTTPWFFIVFFFLGAAAGFRNLLREAEKTDDSELT